MEGFDAKLNTMKSADANHETNIGTDQDVDVKELIGDMLTSGDGTSSMLYTKALITDPEKLKPVRLHMTIKKRKGNLLECIKLSRVKFLDNEHDAMDAVDDPKSLYYEIDETVKKKQKVSSQSTKTIEAFWQKYHTKLGDDDEVQAITPEFTTALDNFIAKSLRSGYGCRMKTTKQI